jgi:hypothetical protein
MFWTRLGSQTGVAASGTVEEIDKMVAAGRPALLYFSTRPVDPRRIDVSQLSSLREFQAITYERALVGAFASVDELSRTLLRQELGCSADMAAEAGTALFIPGWLCIENSKPPWRIDLYR